MMDIGILKYNLETVKAYSRLAVRVIIIICQHFSIITKSDWQPRIINLSYKFMYVILPLHFYMDHYQPNAIDEVHLLQ